MFDDLYIATGLCVLKSLSEEKVPVRYTSKEFANVYEVEVVRGECPLERDIVDFEVAVWRDPFRLYGREVGASDSGRGILVGHVLARVSADGGPGGDGDHTIAQMPVPVPQSKMVCGLCTGAKWSFWSRVKRYM